MADKTPPTNQPQNLFNGSNIVPPNGMDGISPGNGYDPDPVSGYGAGMSPDEYKLSGGIANLVPPHDMEEQDLSSVASAEEDDQTEEQSQSPSALQEKKEALENFSDRRKELKDAREEKTKAEEGKTTSQSKSAANVGEEAGEAAASSAGQIASRQLEHKAAEAVTETAGEAAETVTEAVGNIGKSAEEIAEEAYQKQVETAQKEFAIQEEKARASQAAKEGRATRGVAKEAEETAAKTLVKEGAEAAEKAVAKDVAKAGAKGMGRLAPGLGFAMDAKETLAGIKDLGHGERPPAATILDLAEDILNVIPGGQPFVWASMLIRLSVRLLGEDEEEIAECLWPKASLLPPQVYYAAHPDELAVNLVKLAGILTRIFVKIVGVVVGLLVSVVIVLLVIIYVVLSTTTGILSQSPNFNGSGTQTSGGGVASSGCAVNTDNCSVEKLNSYGITNNCSRNGEIWNGEAMSRICTHESSGVAKMSGTDRCDQQVTYPDGHTGYLSWSGGLFQIDIFHASDTQFPECKGLVEVKSVTSSHASAHNTSHGGCLDGHWRNSASGGYCDLRKCGLKTGVTEAQYKNCVNALFNNEANYKAACSKYKSQGYSAWVDSATKCGVINK